MTRRTVRLVSAPLTFKRENGKHVARDEAAGYYRVMTRIELAKAAAQITAMLEIDILCEGKIPKRD